MFVIIIKWSFNHNYKNFRWQLRRGGLAIEHNIAIKRCFSDYLKNIINLRKIWVERGATERNRLIAVMLSDRREDEILVQRCPKGKNLELRVRRKFLRNSKAKYFRLSFLLFRFFCLCKFNKFLNFRIFAFIARFSTLNFRFSRHLFFSFNHLYTLNMKLTSGLGEKVLQAPIEST